MKLSFVILLIVASMLSVKVLHREHELRELDRQFQACSTLPDAKTNPDCLYYLN